MNEPVMKELKETLEEHLGRTLTAEIEAFIRQIIDTMRPNTPTEPPTEE